MAKTPVKGHTRTIKGKKVPVKPHMRRKPIRVRSSYNIITPESAEEGDYAEIGWLDEEGVEFDPEEYEEYGEDVIDAVVDYLEMEGVIEASGSSFYPGIWYESSEIPDYQTGEVEIDHYFIDNATPEEEKEIYKRLKKKGMY